MASMGDKTSPLEEQLKRLYTYREMLRNSFEDTAEDIKTIKNTIGDEVVIPDFKSEEIIECHDNLGKDPTVLVCGQVNCGKSSLINQLLKGNRPVLPISDQPCTARLVRLYYSPTKQITLKSKSGGIKRDNLPFRRRTLKQLIHLPEKLREQENEISDVVEIGLDNELLRCGLQLIDAPGINEGEGQLGDIVEKYIDGTLQLLLYVIDGNRSFNKKDLGFITAVKTRCPGIEIIYVCNKVEEDRRATTMDTPDDEDEETFVKSLHDRDKASLVYKKLYSARLVNKNVHDYKQSEELFGISCEMIEKAQRCDKQDEYEEYIYQYQRLLKRIGEQYSKCFKDALSTVATRLNMIQKRVFDYCLNDKVLIEIRAMGADDFKEKLAQLKASVTIDPDKDLKNLECSKDDLVRGMECRIDNMLERLRDDVRQLELGNNIDDNRKIILDFVLMRVLSKWQAPLVKIVDVAVCCLTKTLEDILEMAKPFDDFISESICLDSLISLSKTDFSRIVRCELKELGKKFKIKAMKEDFVCLFGKTLKKDSVHWKCSTAEIMLKSIDTKALIERLLVGLKDIIRKVVDEFASLVGTIETHYSQRVAKRDDEVLSLCDLFPPFGSRICLTEALKSTLEHETVQLGEALASGHRGVVYNGSWRGLHSICCAEEVVFKVWNSDRTMPNYVLGQTWNFERLMPKSQLAFTVPVKALALDDEYRLVWMFSRAQGDTLFVLLTSKSNVFKAVPLNTRLGIIVQILRASQRYSERGFHFAEYSPNNIFVNKDENGEYQIKMNMKWESLAVPYPLPDGKPPFHIAPEIYRAGFACANLCESYSIAVLLVFVVIGEFKRVPCVNTDDVTEIRDAVCSGSLAKALVDLVDHAYDVNPQSRKDLSNLAANSFRLYCDNRASTKTMLEDLLDIIASL